MDDKNGPETYGFRLRLIEESLQTHLEDCKKYREKQMSRMTWAVGLLFGNLIGMVIMLLVELFRRNG